MELGLGTIGTIFQAAATSLGKSYHRICFLNKNVNFLLERAKICTLNFTQINNHCFFAFAIEHYNNERDIVAQFKRRYFQVPTLKGLFHDSAHM